MAEKPKDRYCSKHISTASPDLWLFLVGDAWQNTEGDTGAQIDLLIDRKDRVINVFELKFSENPYTITQSYATQLAQKIAIFKEKTATKKSVSLAMLTPFGVQNNAYAAAMLQFNMTMDVLFENV